MIDVHRRMFRRFFRPTALSGLLFPGLVAPPLRGQIIVAGGEIPAGTSATFQGAPAMAADTMGNFVVAWQRLSPSNGGWDIYARRYTFTATRRAPSSWSTTPRPVPAAAAARPSPAMPPGTLSSSGRAIRRAAAWPASSASRPLLRGLAERRSGRQQLGCRGAPPPPPISGGQGDGVVPPGRPVGRGSHALTVDRSSRGFASSLGPEKIAVVRRGWRRSFNDLSVRRSSCPESARPPSPFRVAL
jgi:hypothetical protein